LIYTAAVYQIDRTGTPLNDPLNAGFSVLTNTRIRGFETELNGYITDAWQSKLGYAYTDARITDNPRAGFGPGTSNILPGNRVQLVSVQPVLVVEQVSNRSAVVGRARCHLLLRFIHVIGRLVKMPGFVRFDAAVYRKIDETWRVQLNIENIFNKGYWASADGDNNISPGQSRTFRLTAIARF